MRTLAIAALLAGFAFGCSVAGAGAPAPQKEQRPMSKKTYTKPSDDELREKLTPLQYEVTQRAATEPPFRNAYWDNHEAGIYVDAVTGEPLFSSLDKFESGTGWPSFTRPIDDAHVHTRTDKSHGMIRTEVLSAAGGSHLGHLFDDGPPPTRQRYCMNSASLRFIPVDRLEAEGYGEYRDRFSKAGAGEAPASTDNECVTPPPGEKAGCEATLDVAILAGGCFWGMEDILRKVPGILETEVGYTGGTTADPTYAQVSTGATGHAESIKIVFDPSKLSYEELLEKWFFRMHDPTTANRQGNDVGTQYRSAIFYTSDEQARVAERAKAKAQARWKAPIVTQIVKAGPFTKAEDYHQDYLEKHPGGYTCHYLRD